MKQLSLVKLNLDVAELLPKEKLKTIFGGYGSGECVAQCTSTCTVSCSGGNCHASDGPNGFCSHGGVRINCSEHCQ